MHLHGDLPPFCAIKNFFYYCEITLGTIINKIAELNKKIFLDEKS